MKKLLFKWLLAPLIFIGIGMGMMAYFGSGGNFSWALFSSNEIHRGEEVIQSISREEQVALVGVSVQGIEPSTEDNREVLGITVPGSFRESLIQYEFTAKLGIDAREVTVVETGENSFRLTIPEFIFIGYEVGDFHTVSEKGGILSFTRERIDGAKVSSEILQAKQDEYIEASLDLLRDQTKFFYTTIIHGVDPTASVEFVFTDN